MTCSHMQHRSSLRLNCPYCDPFASTLEQPLPPFHILMIHCEQLGTRAPCFKAIKIPWA